MRHYEKGKTERGNLKNRTLIVRILGMFTDSFYKCKKTVGIDFISGICVLNLCTRLSS